MAKARVLVIDDDKTILDILKLALQNAGFEVLPAIDGNIGLKIFREQKPELAIVDIAMPGVDGYQVIEEIKKASEGQSAKVVILTAHEQSVMRAYADELGVDLYLTKPITPSQLIEHLNALLEK
jgi:DNA-binding response OmpR family regulator